MVRRFLLQLTDELGASSDVVELRQLSPDCRDWFAAHPEGVYRGPVAADEPDRVAIIWPLPAGVTCVQAAVRWAGSCREASMVSR